MILQAVIHTYLILVLYTHWMNSDLPVKEGGLLQVKPVEAAEMPTVESATDDENLTRF